MQDLQVILIKLREKYQYCLFCGCQASSDNNVLYHKIIFAKVAIFLVLIIVSLPFLSMNQWKHSYPTAQEQMKMTIERLFLITRICSITQLPEEDATLPKLGWGAICQS
ncbi:hypothetical protein HYC85_003991 [Camellia sinensis]|uniref:DUF4187 domain-containing protein n=1 Tax=Camellia sinensis TaxID=4442 RepID=A0A7J7HXC1_CAMSI|nr:hypothetical protein HYC85_003991 [Camellia sinensis]